jgi:hypothetical protein
VRCRPTKGTCAGAMADLPHPTRADVRLGVTRVGDSAQACVEVGRLSREEALAEIAEALTPLTPERRQEALAHAAAPWLGDRWSWHAELRELLAAAGADLDRAATIAQLRADRHRIRLGDAEL